MPASSIARADSSISSSGSIVSCITPMRNGTARVARLVELVGPSPGVVRLGRERADPVLGAAACDRVLHLRVERREHVRDLLVDDRLQHALAHRADRARRSSRRPPTSSACRRRRRRARTTVCMFSIAPTPLPLMCSAACSGARSSVFSMSIFIFRPPRPSGIFTFAVQRLSSCTSKLSTPGIVFAIDAGSFSTFHTALARRGERALARDVHASTTSRARRLRRARSAAPRRGGTGCSCRRRSRRRGCAARPGRGADRVDAGAAALAHALRAERRERRRALDAAGLQRRHVERVRHVVVVEVRGEQVAVLVVDERPRASRRRAPARSRPSPGPRRSAG